MIAKILASQVYIILLCVFKFSKFNRLFSLFLINVSKVIFSLNFWGLFVSLMCIAISFSISCLLEKYSLFILIEQFVK